MNLLFAQELPRLFGSVAPNDNAIPALAIVIGVVCGVYLANLSGQLGAKRARALRKNPPRRPDE
jgi:hypothetical protein